MKFAALRTAAEHARANRAMGQLFVDAGAKRTKLRLAEGVVEALILADEDVWLGRHRLPNRYRNAFGVGDPFARKPPWPSVQLNLALEPGRARPQARYVRDADNQLWVAHTGTLGGRVAGISREGFLAFLGVARDVTIDDAPERLVVLGTFAKPRELLQRIVHLTHAADVYRAGAAIGAS